MLNRRLYNLVGNTRISDTAKGLYDKESHINTKYLLILKFKSGDKCYHCNCDLDWDNLKHTRRDRQVTLQRIDNTKGHIKGNCQFACFSCNVKKRMENREILLNRFDKNKTYTYEEIREILIKDNLFT
jgi:DNA polymerase II small subunit/DNA polymerase delta subunit B